MKTLVAVPILVGLIAVTGCSRTPSVGPNGGDLVSIKGDSAYAELVSNPETGEVMVQTWDEDLKTRRPIEREPITVGSDENDVQLMPYPTETDPEGTCSRFYGQADWARGDGIHRGWMQGPAREPARSSRGRMVGRPAGCRAGCGRRWAATGTWVRSTHLGHPGRWSVRSGSTGIWRSASRRCRATAAPAVTASGVAAAACSGSSYPGCSFL